jgi:hypothetical protein
LAGLLIAGVSTAAPAPAGAQTPSWTNRLHSADHDVPALFIPHPQYFQYKRSTRHLAVDAGGSVYVAGTIEPQARSCFVAKYDILGNVVWMDVPPLDGCSAAGIALDGVGGVYLAGTFGMGLPADVSDWLIAKYDSSGLPVWTRTWDDAPAQSSDDAHVIAANAGGVVVFGGAGDFTVATRRYDPAGTLLWEARDSGHYYPFPYGLGLDSSGRVTVSMRDGYVSTGTVIRYGDGGSELWRRTISTAYTTGIPLAVDDLGNAWVFVKTSAGATVVKWNADGQEAWRTPLGSSAAEPRSIAVRQGRAAVAYLDSGSARVASLETTGALLWSQELPREATPWALEITPTGRIGVAGERVGPSGYDFWVSVYDPLGSQAWQHSIDVAPGGRDGATAIAIGADDSIYLGGPSQGVTPDITTVKYSANGALQWVVKEPPAPANDFYNRPVFDVDGSITALASEGSYSRTELRRFSAGGQLQWATPAHPRLYNFRIDQEGSVIGVGTLGDYATEAVILERFGRNGTRLWTRTYAVENARVSAGGMAVDLAGSVIVSVYRNDRPTLVKYDRDGTLVWVTGELPGSGFGLTTDDSGAIYASGAVDSDLAVHKYSPLGALLWTRTWSRGSGTIEQQRASVVDAWGNVILTGVTGPLNQGTEWHYATLKFDPAGNLLWARTHGVAGAGNYASDVAVDGYGNVIVTGLSREGLGFGIRTVSYDTLGNERWVQVHPGGAFAGGEFSYSTTTVTASFEGASTIATRTWNGTNYDATVLRYDRAGSLVWVSTLAGGANESVFNGSWWVAGGPNGAAAVSASTLSRSDGLDGHLLYFDGEGPTPRRYHLLDPCRILDTRDPGRGGPSPVAAGTTRNVRTTGTCGIPETARALAVNVTVTEATAPGHLRVFAAGFAAPNASTANYVPGQTRANNAVVALGAGGRLGLLVGQASGTVHVIVDVSGYFE